MKWKLIRHLIKVIWMVYRDKLMMSKIYMGGDIWYVNLYTRKYYEEMFLIKEELDEGDKSPNPTT